MSINVLNYLLIALVVMSFLVKCTKYFSFYSSLYKPLKNNMKIWNKTIYEKGKQTYSKDTDSLIYAYSKLDKVDIELCKLYLDIYADDLQPSQQVIDSYYKFIVPVITFTVVTFLGLANYLKKLSIKSMTDIMTITQLLLFVGMTLFIVWSIDYYFGRLLKAKIKNEHLKVIEYVQKHAR